MSQSKTMSMIETVTNVGLGYLIAIGTQMVIFPWFDIHTTVTDNMIIAAVFTVISVIRGYIVRRAFNWWAYR